MRPNSEKRDQVARDRRRAQVAKLAARGLTQREIVEALERGGYTNPRTGHPWKLRAVNEDLKRLTQEWRERAAEDIEYHRARMLEELRQVKAASWAAGDRHAVLKALSQERALLGVDQDPATATGNVIEGVRVTFVGSAPDSAPEPIATPDDS